MKPLKFTESGVTAMLEKMVSNGNKTEAFLNRVAYRIYQNYQTKRWMAEGSYDGLSRWKSLDPKYKQAKKKRFAAYPGSGEHTLIATGSLVASVVGPGFTMPFLKGSARFHRKMVSGSTMTISTSIPYAEYVNDVRPFDEYGPQFKKEIGAAWFKYIRKGE